MHFDIDIAWLLAVGLISIRLGVLFFATPFDAMGRLPTKIRVFATLLLSVFFVSVSPPLSLVVPASAVELVAMGLQELLVGLVMAFGFYCVFGSIMVAGKLMDFQAGFGAAQILNPATNAANPLYGTVLSLFAVAIFYASNAYQLALRGIAWSIAVSPPGTGLAVLPIGSIVRQFGLTYIYGITLAAPIVGVLLLLDTGVAVMGRTMPQMNVYFLFLPLKIGVAFVLVIIALRYISPVLERMFVHLFQYWQQALS